MAHLVKPKIIRYENAAGKRVPKGTPGAKRIETKAKKWYAASIPGMKGKLVPLARDKVAANKMLSELEIAAERSPAGLSDLNHAARELVEHLADFEAHLRAGRASSEHVKIKIGRIRRLIVGCKFTYPANLETGPVESFLTGLRAAVRSPVQIDPKKAIYTRNELAAVLGLKPESVHPLVKRHGLAAEGNGKARRFPRATVEALRDRLNRGRGTQTANYYLREIKAFCRWMTEEGRLAKNPLAKMRPNNAQLDRRHDRRNLTAEELPRLLDATRASCQTFEGLNPEERHMLYLMASATGFRAKELASLIPERTDLDATPPTVTLPARVDKRRKAVRQPIPANVAELLRQFLVGRPEGKPLWPGLWYQKAAKMLRMDLEAAGIPYIVEGPDGPLFADFHSLRHTFISMMDRAGLSIKQAQTLARHSDPKLTIGRYTHSSLAELGEAVERLPIIGVREVAPMVDWAAVEALAAVGLILWHTLISGSGTTPAAVPATRTPRTPRLRIVG